MRQTRGGEASPLPFLSDRRGQRPHHGADKLFLVFWGVDIEHTPILTVHRDAVLIRPLLFENDVAPLLQDQRVVLVSREHLYAHHAVFIV